MAHLERLKQFISYDPATGRFHWIRTQPHANRVKVGQEVGWLAKSGHLKVNFDGRVYFLHRIAWVLHNGPVPDGFEIDHRDGNPLNNALTNLRLATKSQNMQNMKMRGTNKTGVKGVSWNKAKRKFEVQIGLNHKKVHGGYFDTVDAAAVRAHELRAEVHGAFARHA
ncbi:HNH endonuclease [Burkholderia pseudomallei]|uniref:HNH endonuclease n=1 Tax=Burkholderia pseudomallei TaxID=28450 RepID=UPI0015C3915E|nr:HNH endonuclease [Burkholderia pseudomallei]